MSKNIGALEWANLNKYQKDNFRLLNIPSEQKRVVFMGDSITEFWPKFTPDFFFGKPYVNRGISGQTTPQMLIRFRADVINLKPEVVVVLAGINDLAENSGPTTIEMICNSIFAMAEMAIANQIKVVLCSILPAFEFQWRKGLQPANKIIVINKRINEYAISNGHHYLDYYSAMVDDIKGLSSIYSEDGVHPNTIGYEVMNPLAEATLAKVLSKN
jgi:lysophospholipase L1-like esterase